MENREGKSQSCAHIYRELLLAWKNISSKDQNRDANTIKEEHDIIEKITTLSDNNFPRQRVQAIVSATAHNLFGIFFMSSDYNPYCS